MGFRMSCDRCGRFLKNVSLKDLKQMKDSEVVCGNCQKIESIAKAQVEKIKKAAQADFEKLANDYKTTVSELLQGIVDGDKE